MRNTLIASTLLLLAAGSAGAATLDIAFTEVEGFVDVGDSPMERERNIATLTAHLRKLAERLPADQRLQIEVTDVDLAGRVHVSSHYPVRVANGGADWPRIDLSYTLQGDGRTLASGTERIGDMYYLNRIMPLTLDEPLGREKRMLDDWFAQRFVPAP